MNFGVGKCWYYFGCLVTKLKEISEVMIHTSVLNINLQKRGSFCTSFLSGQCRCDFVLV